MEVRKKNRAEYSLEDLAEAVEEVNKGLMSVSEASRLFAIPQSTIKDQLQQKYKTQIQGKGPIFTTDEENEIRNWIFQCSSAGFHMNKARILETASDLLKIKTRNEKSTVGEKWFRNFVSRSPEISKFVAKNVTKASSVMSRSNIRGWHQFLTNYFTENNIMHFLENHPESIFAGYEINFQRVQRRKRNVYEISQGKPSVSSMLTISASGQLVPHLIIYRNTNRIVEIARKMPGHYALQSNAMGCMNAKIFLEYLIWLKKTVKPESFMIYFVDSLNCHLSIETGKFCNENKIFLVGLFPNSPRILRDARVHKAFESSFKAEMASWCQQHPNESFDVDQLAPMIKKVNDLVATPDAIRKSFRECGIYPWNTENIDVSSFPRSCPNTETDTETRNWCGNFGGQQPTSPPYLNDDPKIDDSYQSIFKKEPSFHEESSLGPNISPQHEQSSRNFEGFSINFLSASNSLENLSRINIENVQETTDLLRKLLEQTKKQEILLQKILDRINAAPHQDEIQSSSLSESDNSKNFSSGSWIAQEEKTLHRNDLEMKECKKRKITVTELESKVLNTQEPRKKIGRLRKC